eukprot:TRINITY_DN20878_c0_g1_i1.p1 TRINITY_DN20878_c0_g1~~TRINITY_DN20878_c0_g1_i1.p1  ORF type:complete len:146 (-),score=44.36 TRINITY_DN20878_c0_g1_i1:110-523(-)
MGDDQLYLSKGKRTRLTAYYWTKWSKGHYDASAEFMGITVDAGVSADISEIQIFLDAEMVLTGGSSLQLTDFRISQLGRISVDVSGLGPLNWILEILVDFVDAFLKDWIVSLVEGPLKDLIQGILDEEVPDIPSWLI